MAFSWSNGNFYGPLGQQQTSSQLFSRPTFDTFSSVGSESWHVEDCLSIAKGLVLAEQCHSYCSIAQPFPISLPFLYLLIIDSCCQISTSISKCCGEFDNIYYGLPLFFHCWRKLWLCSWLELHMSFGCVQIFLFSPFLRLSRAVFGKWVMVLASFVGVRILRGLRIVEQS